MGHAMVSQTSVQHRSYNLVYMSFCGPRVDRAADSIFRAAVLHMFCKEAARRRLVVDFNFMVGCDRMGAASLCKS